MSIIQYDALHVHILGLTTTQKIVIWRRLSWRTISYLLRTCEDGIWYNASYLGRILFRYNLRGQAYEPINPGILLSEAEELLTHTTYLPYKYNWNDAKDPFYSQYG